jgi:single-strand DNA-binding protein
MSGSVNKVIVVGNLGRDPEVSYSQAGTPRAKFSVATSERFKDREGNDRQETEWHNIVVFGKTAENVGKYLTKGRSVYVEGKLKTRTYEKDGAKHYIIEIIAHQVVFLGGGGGGGEHNAPASGGGGGSGGAEGAGSGGGPSGADDDIPF